ncbi:surface adhesion protein, partial [Pseudomonas benzenivorans]
MSNFVAIVKSLVGQVFAVSLEGFKRPVFEGERLLQGEQILTELGGSVTLQLANDQLIEVGQNSNWQADRDETAEHPQADEEPTSELEQAIAAGFDPTAELEPTAAGPGATGGTGGAAGGGHSFVLLDETAGQLDPTLGFATQGLDSASSTNEEELGALADSLPVPNAAPLAVDDSLSATEDTPVTFTAAQLTGNDSDPENSPLTIASVTSGSGGTAVLNADGTVTFTPNANFTGTADFSYTVTDGERVSNGATVTIVVGAAADLGAADDSASGAEDSVINGSVIGNDSTTSGGALSYALASGVSNGSLVFNADGSYSYTPDANFNGADSFTYTVTDAASGESSTQTVSLSVNPVADLSAADDSATGAEDSVINGSVIGNDS